jgi:alkylhydroperoxidase family enzyme
VSAVARLPYLEADQSSSPELIHDLYSQINGWGRPVAHLYKVLANQPPALAAFLGMSHYIRDRSSLDPTLREMAILATSRALDQPYERAHHEPLAVAAGIPAVKVAAIAEGHWNELGPFERAVVAYADQVACRREVDDAVFEQLKDTLTDAELTDLVLTVAWYHLCAAILGPLRVEVEPEHAVTS